MLLCALRSTTNLFSKKGLALQKLDAEEAVLAEISYATSSLAYEPEVEYNSIASIPNNSCGVQWEATIMKLSHSETRAKNLFWKAFKNIF